MSKYTEAHKKYYIKQLELKGKQYKAPKIYTTTEHRRNYINEYMKKYRVKQRELKCKEINQQQ